MSLKLLLDEDSQAKYLVNLLRGSGHDVITANDAGLGGLLDSVVLDYARQQKRVILTRNCDDFLELHQFNPFHEGDFGCLLEHRYIQKHELSGDL